MCTAHISIEIDTNGCNYRLSINRPTKRGKEKYLSDGHCQCGKEMEDHLLSCEQIFEKSHIVTRASKELVSILKINNINDISFCGTSDCHCCSIA
jgi:hypothetical protein